MSINDDGSPRRMIYLGSIDAADNVIIPREAFARADAESARERAAKALADEKAALAITQAARAQGRLKRALRAVFGRRR
jgi:hypothetical protein